MADLGYGGPRLWWLVAMADQIVDLHNGDPCGDRSDDRSDDRSGDRSGDQLAIVLAIEVASKWRPSPCLFTTGDRRGDDRRDDRLVYSRL